MRILSMNWRDWTDPRAGGAEEDLHQLCRYAATCGNEVDVFCSRYQGSGREAYLDGCRVHRYGNRFTVYPLAVREAIRQDRRARWDVLVDDVNGIPWFSPVYAPGRSVTIFHHAVGRTFFQELPFPVSAAGLSVELLLPKIYRNSVITVRSERMREYLSRRGANRDKTFVVPSGLDHSVFRPTAPKHPEPKFLFVGPIKHYKHPEVALKVLEACLRFSPNASIDIIGRDPSGLVPRLLRLADQSSVRSRVSILGFVEPSLKAKLMSRAWTLLVPSEREGWSLASLEANACGTPVVAFDVGGMRDSVADARSGFLAPPGRDDYFIAAAMSLTKDDSLRRRMSAGAIEWSRQFSWDRYCRSMLSLLESVAG